LISPGKDNYLDNEAIIEQFKRLFTLMNYSEIIIRNGFRVDLLVDNATTHTKALIDISMFAKSINRACPVNEIKWFLDVET
jgi:hypothetical protein